MDWSAKGSEAALRLTPTPTPQRPVRASPQPALFVIDADPSRGLGFADLLEGRYRVHQFESAEAALAALADLHPDVVLIAAAVNGLEPAELCRRFKAHALPVVLLLGSDAALLPAHAEAGFDDFLRTPTTRVELRARLGTLVKTRQLQAAQQTVRQQLESLRLQLEEAERLATLGTFAAGVGHELNNVTTVLTSTVDELGRTRQVDDDLLLDLTEASQRVQQLAAAVQHLAMPSAHETMVNLGQLIQDVLLMTRLTGRTKYVAVEFTPPSSPVFLKLVAVELQQVVLNLVTNAADALSSSSAGRIGIELCPEVGAVLLRITDNGPGFSAEARAHLLDPHFTTKAPGLSTGLGLALVRQLVTSWGGSADLLTQPGAGSCVEVRIPLERRSHSTT